MSEGINNNAKALTIESLKDALRLFEERMGTCAMATDGFRDAVLLVPETFKIPWDKERQANKAASTLSPNWSIPVIRMQYLPTVSLEPAMPTRTGRTRRGYKIAHKFALNERRRRSRLLGQCGYLLKGIVDRQSEDMFRKMFSGPAISVECNGRIAEDGRSIVPDRPFSMGYHLKPGKED